VDGVFAELGFEEEAEAGEAGCWVGGAVGVGLFWAVGEGRRGFVGFVVGGVAVGVVFGGFCLGG
tara:strand:- start:6433 stop:6624 length:192 start_codon:yes stop_codon:yes gene_type:complete